MQKAWNTTGGRQYMHGNLVAGFLSCRWSMVPTQIFRLFQSHLLSGHLILLLLIYQFKISLCFNTLSASILCTYFRGQYITTLRVITSDCCAVGFNSWVRAFSRLNTSLLFYPREKEASLLSRLQENKNCSRPFDLFYYVKDINRH